MESSFALFLRVSRGDFRLDDQPRFHGENKSLNKSNTQFPQAGIYYHRASGFKKP